MSSGAYRSLSYTEEATAGVSPLPLNRKVLPFTDTTIDQTANKTDSQTIASGRLQTPSSIIGLDVAGDINAEFRYGSYDSLIAGAACNEWSGDTLFFGGDIKKWFSFLIGFTDVDVYQLFSGNRINTWSVSVPEEGLVETTFGIMGMSRASSIENPSGLVTPDPLNPAYSSISVGQIKLDGVDTAGNFCVTSFDFTWDNQMQKQRCLGGGLSVGNILAMMASGTGSVNMAWSKDLGQKYYEDQFNNKTASLELYIRESNEDDGNSYILRLPKVEYTMPLPTGGRGDILTATFTYNVVSTDDGVDAPTLTRIPKVIPPPED